MSERRAWRASAWWVVPFVALALLVASCGSDSSSGSGTYKEPTGAATSSLGFDGRNFAFDPKDATTPAGIVDMTLKSSEGGHTLVIQGVPGFKLTAAASGDKETKKVELKKGTYTFYCDIPGHREAGMEGKLKVT